MKLRNKRTGEIVERVDLTIREEGVVFNNDETYSSLAELNEEWEDYEEPTTYYYINNFGAIREGDVGKFIGDKIVRKEIGNYFETRKESEKAVEKLEAWKRLKDKGFRFVGWQDSVSDNNPDMALFKLGEDDWETDVCEDLDLLFGGEE